MSTNKQHRRYVFTLNNYTAEEIESIGTSTFRYIIYGREIGESGTPHLQGYLEVAKPMTFVAIKKQCPGFQRANFEVAKGKREQCVAYCSKGEQSHKEWEQYGTCGPNWGKLAQVTEIGDYKAGGQGARTDWQQIWSEIAEGSSFIEVAREHPEQAIKYHSGIKACIASVNTEVNKLNLQKEIGVFKPYKWQHELLKDLEKKPDQRKVIWIVDDKGNRGKTWLAKHLLANMSACCFANCKTADVAHAYNGERIAVFDYSRSNEDRINYGIIEQIKNGLIFSPKYDSRTKVHAIPHVVCLSNFAPDRSMMSADRWDIRVLNDDSVVPIENVHEMDILDEPTEDNIEQLIEEVVDELELYGVDLSKDVHDIYTPDEDDWISFEQAITPPCRSQVAIPLPEWYNMHSYFGLPKDLPTVANVHISPAVQAAIEQLTVSKDHLDTREAGNTGTASLTCPNNSPMSIEYQDYLAEKKLRYLIQHQNDDTDDEFTDCEDIYTSSEDI